VLCFFFSPFGPSPFLAISFGNVSICFVSPGLPGVGVDVHGSLGFAWLVRNASDRYDLSLRSRSHPDSSLPSLSSFLVTSLDSLVSVVANEVFSLRFSVLLCPLPSGLDETDEQASPPPSGKAILSPGSFVGKSQTQMLLLSRFAWRADSLPRLDFLVFLLSLLTLLCCCDLPLLSYFPPPSRRWLGSLRRVSVLSFSY